MKTNKQRADIILERYQKNKETQNQQNINKVSPKKHSWFNLKAFAYSMAATLVIIGVSLGLFFGLRQNDLDLSKMYILNFDKYVAIGAGSQLTNDEQVSANVLSFDANSAGKNYMIGVDQYGNVEKLRFALNNNTSETDQTEQEEIDKQDWQVSKIKIFERFIVVEFGTSIATREYFWLNHTYVIDNETGKMYYLNNSDETNYIYFVSEDTIFFDSEKEGIDMEHMEQTKDSIYFYTPYHTNNTIKINKVYRVYVKNDELVVEEVYNKDMRLILESYFVDKYDNFYILPTYAQYEVSYCISNNKLLFLDTELRKDVNGIAYTLDGTKQVDQYGNLVDSTFSGEHMWLAPADLIKRTGNVDYYYRSEITNNQNITTSLDYIYKVTWQDDVNYTFEKIYIQNWSDMHPKQFVFTNDYIYFRSDEKIYKTEITTGTTTELISEYYFTDISTDNLGNVSFKALNVDMNNVYGIINNEGEINIDIQDREYMIYYIKPLKID